MKQLAQGLDKGYTNSFREYFENFLWARETTPEVNLTDIGFTLTPKGAIDMRHGVDKVRFAYGTFAKFKTTTGMRVVLLMTRLGAIGLYEYIEDPSKPNQLKLGLLQSTAIATHWFIRKVDGNDAQLEQLLWLFGVPEKGIMNLAERLDALAEQLVVTPQPQ
jgi:hypothetical protein